MADKTAYTALDNRARDIFTHIVEAYMRSGEPIGSRLLSKDFGLSPATIRNVMADLEDLGLLEAPHVSAGRMPSEAGLRYFIDGILEVSELGEEERRAIERQYGSAERGIADTLEQTTKILSALSASAGLVIAPKADKALRHIEFVGLEPGRALAILVLEDGMVENRVMTLPPGVTPDILRKAGTFLGERLHGKTLAQMRGALGEEIRARRSELGELTARVIEAGLAMEAGDGTLIVRGQANLLSATALQDLERIRHLMDQLESKETVSRLLEEALQAGGVKIFIGSENPIFQTSGYSLILRPYQNAGGQVVGAVGVIGPTRIDYARIIPSVNFMADVISRKIRAFSEG